MNSLFYCIRPREIGNRWQRSQLTGFQTDAPVSWSAVSWLLIAIWLRNWFNRELKVYFSPSASASVQNRPNPTSSILISSLPALTIDVTSATSLRERSPGNTLCSVRSPSPCEDGRSSHIVVVEIHWRWSGSTFGSSSGFSQSFINADNFRNSHWTPPTIF